MKVARIAVLAVAGIGLAVGGGFVGSALVDPTDSDEYQGMVERKNAVIEQGVEALEQADEALAVAAEIEGDLPEREAALASALAELDDAQGELTEAQKVLAKSEKSVAKREKAVGIVEREVERNTIPGDGVYRVGQDMKPGTYRSVDNSGCYYQISSDPNGDNIVTNHIGNGPVIVSVTAGRYFQTERCSDWVLQP